MQNYMFSNAHNIWKNLSRDIDEEQFQLDLNIDKKLLSYFHVGNYYYFIFNIKRGAFDLISDEMEAMLGYTRDEYTVPFLVSNIHPEDQPFFLNFENKVVEFFLGLTYQQIPNYKVSYDYRLRKKNGSYLRLLQQVVTISYDKDRRLLRTLGIHTDISHIKPEGAPLLSFIGLNGEPSYHDVDVKNLFAPSQQVLTNREREVLCLIASGKSSMDIAELLHISKQTVDTHRKNLLQKTEAENSAQLISVSVKNGWI